MVICIIGKTAGTLYNRAIEREAALETAQRDKEENIYENRI